MRHNNLALSCARACVDERTVVHVFEPLIADWQREWLETRGVRKLWVLVSGGAAFVWSLLRCFNLLHVAQRTPARGFALVATLFVLASVAFQMQPVQFTWRHWAWSDPLLYVFVPRADAIWLVPSRVAFGLMVAVLPASLLAAAFGCRPRRLLTACAVAAALILVTDGWLAPIAMRERADRFWTSRGLTPLASIRSFMRRPDACFASQPVPTLRSRDTRVAS